MARRTKTQRQNQFGMLATSLKAEHPASEVFVIENVRYRRDELAGIFEQCLAASERTRAARAAWMQAVSDEARLHAKGAGVRKLVESMLRAVLGPTNPKLTRYGIKPKVVAERPAKDKLRAAEKAKATRKLRGTRGRRQKAKIKGPLP